MNIFFIFNNHLLISRLSKLKKPLKLLKKYILMLLTISYFLPHSFSSNKGTNLKSPKLTI